MSKYTETIHRHRVFHQPQDIKCAPNCNWSLVFSSPDEKVAEEFATEQRSYWAASGDKFKVVDRKVAVVVERESMF